METEPQSMWRVPALSRSDRVVAGAAGGIARELGIDPLLVRVSFVVLAAAGGWGVLLYGVAWAAMATWGAGSVGEPARKGSTDGSALLGYALIVVGLLFTFRLLGGGFIDAIVWPVALLGLAVVVAANRGVRLDRLVAEQADSTPTVRLAAAAALVAVGVVLAVTLNFDLRAAAGAALIAAVLVAGLALVVAPWGTRLVSDLSEERRRRIRSEERADVAAHLHDSVLQTLALIQRQAADPEVISLARRQERELRGWLFDADRQRSPAGFRSKLELAMAGVEERHRIPIEVVVVGETAADERLDAMLAAATEAASNAAVHSGASRIDVFAEIGPSQVDVFVRDAGVGFDPSTVPADRKGVRESIQGRLRRVGGSATIISAPGTGTEVELTIPMETNDAR